MFDFDDSGRDSKRSNGNNAFTKVGVQFDKNTGSFVGVENFYRMVGANGSVTDCAESAAAYSSLA